MKPWTPTVVNPTATFLHEQYDIPEPRRLALSIKMTNMTKSEVTVIVPVSNHIEQIAEMCDTPGEFAYCLFVHAIYLAQTNNLLT